MSVELKEKGRWDPLKVFSKVSAAYLLSLFTKKKSGKKIALVGGNLGEKYEDNAAVYHKYLLKMPFHWAVLKTICCFSRLIIHSMATLFFTTSFLQLTSFCFSTEKQSLLMSVMELKGSRKSWSKKKMYHCWNARITSTVLPSMNMNWNSTNGRFPKRNWSSPDFRDLIGIRQTNHPKKLRIS